ncbi:hypothetical protein DMC25_06530 [Caulobacter sp. D4A]|uniref:hypothetical protein n=1 Tax=unclassified Caulobacter TaxID=2648921 RepID=UPI000D7332B1|nr:MULTISPECIES: hypothetical protein [unclassified Caulobacter]PXA91204.1 hypothetical protein DMC25_06530 [Caulobacter sp. D4A]PXA96775.1 hypothetical protein DMC18_00490 [Caulobacter sp. D5]
MQFRYPYVEINAGRSDSSCVLAISTGRNGLYIDVGPWMLDIYWYTRVYRRDFKMLARAYALRGIAIYTLALAFMVPLAILYVLGEGVGALIKGFSSRVVQPVLDRYVLRSRWGVRDTFASLWAVVVAR